MKPNVLVGALVAAGIIGTGAAAWQGQIAAPFTSAQASPVAAAGVAAPAANPAATSLPLTGFTDIVKRAGPAVVNVSVDGMRKASAEMPQIPDELRDFFRGFGFGGKGPQMPRGGPDAPVRRQRPGVIDGPDGSMLTHAHLGAGAEQ